MKTVFVWNKIHAKNPDSAKGDLTAALWLSLQFTDTTRGRKYVCVCVYIYISCSCSCMCSFTYQCGYLRVNTGCTQKNGGASKVNKKLISHLTRAQRTPSAAATVRVSHALPAVRLSCLLRGRGASFKDGVAAGKGFLCALFWGVQNCDYSAAWVSCTV